MPNACHASHGSMATASCRVTSSTQIVPFPFRMSKRMQAVFICSR